jgi:hypothetical protein
MNKEYLTWLRAVKEEIGPVFWLWMKSGYLRQRFLAGDPPEEKSFSFYE